MVLHARTFSSQFLVSRLIETDLFDFQVPHDEKDSDEEKRPLRLVGGVDISHGSDDENLCCAGYVFLNCLVLFVSAMSKINRLGISIAT